MTLGNGQPPSPKRTWATRDSLLFLCGLAGLTNEAVLEEHSDPWLVGAYLVMMGVPGVAAIIAELVKLRGNGK